MTNGFAFGRTILLCKFKIETELWDCVEFPEWRSSLLLGGLGEKCLEICSVLWLAWYESDECWNEVNVRVGSWEDWLSFILITEAEECCRGFSVGKRWILQEDPL